MSDPSQQTRAQTINVQTPRTLLESPSGLQPATMIHWYMASAEHWLPLNTPENDAAPTASVVVDSHVCPSGAESNVVLDESVRDKVRTLLVNEFGDKSKDNGKSREASGFVVTVIAPSDVDRETDGTEIHRFSNVPYTYEARLYCLPDVVENFVGALRFQRFQEGKGKGAVYAIRHSLAPGKAVPFSMRSRSTVADSSNSGTNHSSNRPISVFRTIVPDDNQDAAVEVGDV